MLDYFAIFTKGGALLWTLQFTTALKHNPIDALNALIRTCLLEGRSSDSIFTYAPKAGAAQSLKWTFHNGLGLVFVAVYQKTLSLLYVDELLQRVKDAFTEQYTAGSYSYSHFNDSFARILRDCEVKADAARRAAALPKAAATAVPPVKPGVTAHIKGRTNGVTAKGQLNSSSEDSSDADDTIAAVSAANGVGSGGSSSGEGSASASDDDSAAANGANGVGEKGFDMTKLKAVSRKAMGGPPGRRTHAAARREVEKSSKDKDSKPSPQKTKKDRVWTGFGRKDEDVGRIDYTEGAPGGQTEAAAIDSLGASRMEEEEADYDDEYEIDEEELRAVHGKVSANGVPAKKGLLSSFMGQLALRVVGSNALTAEDIAPALEDMKRKLMERNVAEEIAGQVVDSVAQSLEGQKLSSFTGVGQFVRQAFEEALSGILNKRQVDVLHDIKRARARGKPYVVVFCGVNGVGKSTNLAKIAYWLGQQGCKVQLAACDTFRAGAVEQLKTHAVRLGVPLYERGYEKDPAKVAAEAIRVAQRDGRDVVLVDTAGRMQDNEPLMRALSNLIAVNQPDLVLFVGEALVGNDAVDQLVKFNRSLADLAPGAAMAGNAKRRIIDGIVLTKFDTIDDKVGAALSMVYASGAPVMFVGCGQTYVDLKRLNVKSVVKSLLK
eukprot:GHRR01000367.1.p1 GENE.GHRR01000367.1~~GHRR01000367.1.p1  ORF type:complete len:663 (+),score=237.67 GHRR01000367.1:308-2296(+)